MKPKMHTIKTFLIFLLLFFTHLFAGDFRGRVILAETGEPLPGVNILVDSLTHVSTGLDGEIMLYNISAGRHILAFQHIFLKSLVDTIELVNDSNNFKIFKMVDDTVKLKTFPEYEKYHHKLHARHDENVFQIKINDIKIRKRAYPRVLLTLELANESNQEIYLAKPDMCWQHFKPVVYNSRGDSIRGNWANLGCDQLPATQYPDSSVLVIIQPKSSILLKVDTYPIAWDSLPKDKYKIRIQYEYDRPNAVKRYRVLDQDMNAVQHVMNLLLRGTYLSENAVTVKKRDLL